MSDQISGFLPLCKVGKWGLFFLLFFFITPLFAFLAKIFFFFTFLFTNVDHSWSGRRLFIPCSRWWPGGTTRGNTGCKAKPPAFRPRRSGWGGYDVCLVLHPFFGSISKPARLTGQLN